MPHFEPLRRSSESSTEQQSNAVLRINDQATGFPPVSFTLPNGTVLAGVSLHSIPLAPEQPQEHTKTSVILCLHGYLDNCHSFVPLLSQLSLDSKYQSTQVIALDFAGHGKSNHRSHDAHYHQSDYIQDIVALIRQQGWDDVCLVGHSMGGIISCSVAAILDDVVSQVLLIETVGPLTDVACNTVQQMRASIDSRISAAQKTPKHPKSYEHVLHARMQVSQLSLAHTDLIMRRNLVFCSSVPQITSHCEWGTDSRLRTVSTVRFTEEQAKDIISHIQCPVIIVVAQDGFDRVRTHAQTRADWFKQQTTIQTLGNHYAHMQYPQLIAQILTQLLEPTLTLES